MKPTLKLPITLRFPEENELPKNSSSLEKLFESRNANIVAGFILKQKDENPKNKDLPFKFYAEINVDNPELWSLVIALSETLPEVCALLFGHSDFEVIYGDYDNKIKILNFLKDYEIELTHDTLLNWGLIYHDEKILIEIFVNESKFLQYWGVNEEKFREIMENFGLNEIENLEFIDEYPKVRENINLHFNNVLDTSELIETLKKKYIK